MLLHWVCARQCDAEMSSTGSEYVAASVVGQKAMTFIHMLTEVFGHIRIAQQQPLTAAAVTTSSAHPVPDGTWQQRAAEFFERHAMGYGQFGPDSPLLPGSYARDGSGPVEGNALPHAAEVASDGSGCTEGPAAYHAMRSGMYAAGTHILPRLELPVPVMIDNTACISILGNVMQSPKVKHVMVRFHCVRGWVRAGYLSPIYINTKKNLADLFTKPLAAMKEKVMIIVDMIADYMDVTRPHPAGAAVP